MATTTRSLSLSLLLIAIFGGMAWGQELPVQGDTYVVSGSSTLEGTSPSLAIQGPTAGALIQFDTSQLAGVSSGQVTKAYLKVYKTAVAVGGTVDVCEVSSSWKESTVTYSTKPSLVKVIQSAVSVATGSAGQFQTIDITQAVQDWLSGTPNNGIAILPSQASPCTSWPTSGNSVSMTIDAKESTTTSHAPEIDVQLNPATFLSGLTSANAAAPITIGGTAGNPLIGLGIIGNTNIGGSYSSTVSFTSNANIFNGTFTGSGSGLTGLNASQLTTGTLPGTALGGPYGNVLTFSNPGNVFSGSGSGLTGVNAATLGGNSASAFVLQGGNAALGNVTATLFTGNGSALSNLNATNLATGTVGDGLLSSNVALVTRSNTFQAGLKQIFTANGTNAGLNIVGVENDPVTLAAGDLWFNKAVGVNHPRFYDGTKTHSLMYMDDPIQTSQLSANSITINTGTGLSGGGSVSLGNSLTLSNAGVLSNLAGIGINVSGATGNVTISNTGVLTVSSGNAGIAVTAGQNPSISNTGVLSVAGDGAILTTTGGQNPIVSVLGQSANTVLAGPASGGAGPVSFRALVSADVPDLGASYIKNGTTQQPNANFNISGNGVLGGSLNINGGKTTLAASVSGASGYASLNFPGGSKPDNPNPGDLWLLSSGDLHLQFQDRNNAFHGLMFTDDSLQNAQLSGTYSNALTFSGNDAFNGNDTFGGSNTFTGTNGFQAITATTVGATTLTTSGDVMVGGSLSANGSISGASVTASTLTATGLVSGGSGLFGGTVQAGNFLGGTFTGDGGALTNLNASNLAQGTVPDARLSNNVALTTRPNTFQAGQTQVFTADATPSTGLAGLNIAGTTGDVGHQFAGDLWYDKTPGVNHPRFFDGTTAQTIAFLSDITVSTGGTNTFSGANTFNGSTTFNGGASFSGTNTVGGTLAPTGGGTITANAFQGILPIANGGTNNNAFTSGQFIAFDGTRLSSTVFDSSSFIQNGTAPQPANLHITGTGTFDTSVTTSALSAATGSITSLNSTTITGGTITGTTINGTNINASNLSASTLFTAPVSGGAAPTTNGAIAYDSTANQFKVGVNSLTNTLALLDGGNTFINGKQALAAPTANFASLNFPNGTAPDPSHVAIGDVWLTSGDTHLQFRDNTGHTQSLAFLNDFTAGNNTYSGNNTFSGTNSFTNTTSFAGINASSLTATGNITANTFSGSGANLTSLNASQLTSGTVPTAALSGTYNISVLGTASNVTGVVGIGNGGTGLALASVNNGAYLRGNGTTFSVSPILAADIPTGSNNYIQNGTAQQTSANFNIDGSGTLGGSFTVTGGKSTLAGSTGTYASLNLPSSGTAPDSAHVFPGDFWFTSADIHPQFRDNAGSPKTHSLMFTDDTIQNNQLQNNAITVSAVGAGISVSGSPVMLGGTVSISNTGVTSVAGTTNQVNVSGSTGAVTFSLPSSVTIGGTMTANLFSGSGASLTNLNPGSLTQDGAVNGQVLAWSGLNWAPATIVTPQSETAPGHQFFNSYNGVTGIFGTAQPSFADIGGQATEVQLPSTTVFTDAVNTYTAGKKQTFLASAASAGFGFGAGLTTSNPSSLANGDIWYRSDLNALKLSNGTNIFGIPTTSGTLNAGNCVKLDANGNLLDSGSTCGASGAAGGDLSGSYPNPAVAKVNGVSYPATPATNTVPVVTGANAVTYQAVPNAALQNSSVTVSAGTGLSGGGSVSLGGSVTLNNAGVTSLAGTANQVSVSAGTGAVTLSLPATINVNTSGSAASATSFTGSLAGDVTGTQGATMVARINGSPLGTTTGAASGQVLAFNGANWAPANFTGSSFGAQNANTVFAGPTTGSPASPTFRALAPADLPVATSGAFGAVRPTIVNAVTNAVNLKNTTLSFSVNCAAGRFVLGGGVNTDTTAHVTVAASFPSAAGTWSAALTGDAAASPVSVTVYAICSGN